MPTLSDLIVIIKKEALNSDLFDVFERLDRPLKQLFIKQLFIKQLFIKQLFIKQLFVKQLFIKQLFTCSSNRQ
jgi:hypothetical protein